MSFQLVPKSVTLNDLERHNKLELELDASVDPSHPTDDNGEES